MSVRTVMSAVALVMLAFGLTAVAVGCGGGDDGTEGRVQETREAATAEVQETEGGAEEVSLDAFVSSARPICSDFASRVSAIEIPDDPAPYEDAASGLAELALPSGAAERKPAEALVEAMGEAAGARGEFLSVMQEYREPGMEGDLSLTEEGRLVYVDWETEDIRVIDDVPAEVGRRLMRRAEEALGALRQAAADLGLERCAPPEEE
jgi:hypothetical protein